MLLRAAQWSGSVRPPIARLKHWQQGLCQDVGSPDIRLVLSVKFRDADVLDEAGGDALQRSVRGRQYAEVRD
jgi:hypothetical protein